MKFILFFCFLIFVFGNEESDWQKWKHFKNLHQKTFKNHVEDATRFAIFQENLRKIEDHNSRYASGLETYQLGLNHFADLSPSEFKGILTLKKSRKPRSLFDENVFQPPQDAELPKHIDWRERGAVTKVKNQGDCGSCWSFSVTGALEGQYFRKTKELVSFSEQNLIDCTKGTTYDLDGCNGGQLDPAFQFIEDHGLEKESDYPYEMKDNECRADNEKIVTKIQGYRDIRENNETELAIAVGLIGPVSVAVDASYMQLYHSGVYNHPQCSPDGLNHGMLVVGYGVDEEAKEYWLVKNSWGLNFGEQGYIKMAKGINQCGIAVQPSFPIL